MTDSHVRELTLRSLKSLVNQLREEIARYTAVAGREIDLTACHYSGPHCLDQKKAFLSYNPEASAAPRPLLTAPAPPSLHQVEWEGGRKNPYLVSGPADTPRVFDSRHASTYRLYQSMVAAST